MNGVCKRALWEKENCETAYGGLPGNEPFDYQKIIRSDL